jgi:hypothetical protein
MAFKVGGTTIVDSSANHILNTNNGNYVGSGIYYNNSVGYEQAWRYSTYTDDFGNCRGYLPSGNCNGSNTWTPPNGNWWTWGASGIPTGNCGNVMGAAGNANCSTVLEPVSVSLVYDAYYVLYDRVRGIEYHRGYSDCNCNSGYNTIGNCYTNCNCNCNC